MNDSLDIKKLLLLRKVYDKCLKEKIKNEIFPSSYTVFAEALIQKEFYSQQELSDFIGCNKAHTSRTLVKMQLKGLVQPVCTKSKPIMLTEKGHKLAQEVGKNKQKFLSELFNGVEESDLNIFLGVMDKVISNAKLLEN